MNLSQRESWHFFVWPLPGTGRKKARRAFAAGLFFDP
jgi:hypothetical protein